MRRWRMLAAATAVAVGILTAGTTAGTATAEDASATPIADAYGNHGQYTVGSGAAVDSAGQRLIYYFPIGLPAGSKSPIVVFAGGASDSNADTNVTSFSALLTTIASHGMTVVASTQGHQGTGDTQTRAANYLITANSDPGSVLHTKLDTSRVGITGYSQGACGAVNVATRHTVPNVKALVPISMVSPTAYFVLGNSCHTESIGNVPTFFPHGTNEEPFMATNPETQKWYDNAVNGGTPAVEAGYVNGTHAWITDGYDTYASARIGYIVAFLAYNLQHDTYARSAFGGANRELFGDPKWTAVAAGNLPDAIDDQAGAIATTYQAYLASIGWQAPVASGQIAGTTGQSRRIEAMKISLTGDTAALGVTYQAHVESVGWQSWVSDGSVAGTTGQGRRLEAIKIQLTGTTASNHDVYYKAFVQNIGWQDWVKNGATAGTTGQGLRIEAIKIVVVPK